MINTQDNNVDCIVGEVANEVIDENPEIPYIKKWYNKNKDNLKEKQKCDICGGTYTRYNKSHHLKTQKHVRIVILLESFRNQNNNK